MSFHFLPDDAAALQQLVSLHCPGLDATARVVDHDTVLLLDVRGEDGLTQQRLGVKAAGAPLPGVLDRFLHALGVRRA